MPKYKIDTGTVQPYVGGFEDAPFIQHFGRPEYDSREPVLPEGLKNQAQPIVDDLNDGKISEEEARSMLKKIW